ncbi:MAG: SpoIIE family protein phosphatase [Myxococcota bacterium]
MPLVDVPDVDWVDALAQATSTDELQAATRRTLQQLLGGPFRVSVGLHSWIEHEASKLGPQSHTFDIKREQACLVTANEPPLTARFTVNLAVALLGLLESNECLEHGMQVARCQLHAAERTQSFLSEVDEDRLLVGILNTGMDLLAAQLGVLASQDKDGWSVRMSFGLPLEAIPCHLLDQAIVAHEPMFKRIVVREDFETDILIVPITARDEAICFVVTDYEADEASATAMSTVLSGLAAIALSNASLVAEALDRQALKAELSVAATTQQGLLPDAPPTIAGLMISSHCEPSGDCGGDYFDFFELDDGSFMFCVADVSGHGVGPALLMATLRGYLRCLLRWVADVGEIAALLNEMLADDLSPNQFITCFLGHIDANATTLQFCSAGHETGLLVMDGELFELAADAPPLGVMVGMNPGVQEIDLRPGAFMAVVTDGLAESEDADGTPYSRSRLADKVKEVSHWESVDDALANILADVTQHRGRAPKVDDETIVIVRATERAS